MERKKRSKGSVWEFCYANKIFGTFGFEMRACGQKLVKFCTLTHIHTHTHNCCEISSKDIGTMPYLKHNESITLRCRAIPELIAYFKCSDTIPSIPCDEPKCNFLMYLFTIASDITLLFNSPFRMSSYFS